MPNGDGFAVPPGHRYAPNPVHRNGMAGKSQWRIALNEEVACFELCVASSWHAETDGWSLHVVNGQPTYLGMSRDQRTQVFVAKFVDGTRTRNWHGYPIDHQYNGADVPRRHILKAWMTQQLLSPAKARKLLKRQPCSL